MDMNKSRDAFYPSNFDLMNNSGLKEIEKDVEI